MERMYNITINQAQETEIPILESILLDAVSWVSEMGEPLWNYRNKVSGKSSCGILFIHHTRYGTYKGLL
jgi:hypothetical protein